MEAENHACDESVSSVDFLFNFNTNIQDNYEIPSANSSNVGLGSRVHYGEVSHYPNTRPNNSGLGNFSLLWDLSLSLNMGSPNRDGSHINTTHAPLFFDLNRAPWPTLNSRPLRAHTHNPMPFRLHFPATHLGYHDYQQHYSGQPNYESHEGSSNEVSTYTSHKQQTSKSLDEQVPHQLAPPRFNHMIRKRARDGALKQCIVRESSRPSICIKDGIGNGRMKNQSTHVSLDGRVMNSVYDIMFEEIGQPIDPHLRLFVPL